MPVSKDRSLGKLYDMLAEVFPTYRYKEKPGLGWKGEALDVRRLAQHIGITGSALYQWFAEDKISAKTAFTLIERTKGQVSYEKIKRFIRR